MKICREKLRYADLIKRAIPGCRDGYPISQIYLNFYLNSKNEDKQRQTEKEMEIAGNIGFYTATNRDKQRQNAVLSFPDDADSRLKKPVKSRVCGL